MIREFLRHLSYKVKQIFTSPIVLLYLLTNRKETIDADLKRWKFVRNMGEKTNRGLLVVLFMGNKEYRNLFYHRVQRGNTLAWILLPVFKFFYPPEPTLKLYADNIGDGLYIQHGIATIVRAEKIGKNCHIGQQVTIGSNYGLLPTIKDHVYIYAGSIVVGDIVLEDNVKIGANSVVIRDCEANNTYVGSPAEKVVRKREKLSDTNYVTA
jgi:serine O-acetyltransferase